MTMLQLSNITITPPNHHVPIISDFSENMKYGQIAALMGPSGIGKSTLIGFIGGHLDPGFATSGSIILNGQDITHHPAEERHIGVLFQDALLFPHLSVGDNLAFGLAAGVRGRAARKAAVDDALAQAGLPGFANRDPASLSGGEALRVALMRTLLAEPAAILLDEPFAKLDTARRAEIREFVFAHIRRRNIPALMVTHDQADAMAAGGPVITL